MRRLSQKVWKMGLLLHWQTKSRTLSHTHTHTHIYIYIHTHTHTVYFHSLWSRGVLSIDRIKLPYDRCCKTTSNLIFLNSPRFSFQIYINWQNWELYFILLKNCNKWIYIYRSIMCTGSRIKGCIRINLTHCTNCTGSK